MTTPDDWKYSRTRQQHFTDAERDFIRRAFREGRDARSVARELRCASRTIYIHYALIRGEGPIRDRVPQIKTMRGKRAPAQDRLYRSQFEPS